MAVSAVEQLFLTAPLIKADITKNDRAECVDGCLQLYSSTPKSVETMVGRIDVQVKGTASKESGDSRKFKVRVVDLRNYLNVFKGCLYFVVYCRKNGATEVFYKSLLPYDLKRILAEVKPGQKTKILRFSRFPTDPCEVERLVMQIMDDREKQVPSAAFALDHETGLDRGSMQLVSQKITLRLLHGEGVATLGPYKDGVYIYGQTDHGLLYPLEKLENVVGVSFGSHHRVRAGSCELDTQVLAGENDDGHTLAFCGMTFYLDKKRVELKEEGLLFERIDALRFHKALGDAGTFTIDGEDSGIHVNLDEESTHAIGLRLEELERYGAALRKVGFKGDLDIDKCGPVDMHRLEILHHTLVEGKTVRHESGETALCDLSILDFKIKLLLEALEPGTFKAYDLLDSKTSHAVAIAYTQRNGDFVTSPIPPLLGLSQDDYEQVGNIDAARFKRDLEKRPIAEDAVDYTVCKVLDMLRAYDKGAFCRDELLECCFVALDAIKGSCDSDAWTINYLQCVRRKRELDASERKQLAAILVTSELRTARACAAVLLGQQEEAEALVQAMVDTERKIFFTWPITRFLE